MLKFVRHVRSHVIPTHGPMLVHCSAGVGRTGTFIAIDILLQRMKEVGGVVNVQEVVCRMRAQRSNMVQTTVSGACDFDDPLPTCFFTVGTIFIHLRFSTACLYPWQYRGQSISSQGSCDLSCHTHF